MISSKAIKSILSNCHQFPKWKNILSSTHNCLTANLPRSPSACYLHTAGYPMSDKEWRKKQGLPVNQNAYGALTDGPDYSFLDGRPTPPGVGKIKRAFEQQEIMTKIMKFSDEVDYAVANHTSRVQNEQQRRSNIIQSKLKRKSNLPPGTRT